MIPPLSSSTPQPPLPSSSSSTTNGSRGAFIVFEGIDRCGKTTQCARLVNKLLAAGIAATAMRFPDRTTATGSIINTYLQSSTDLDDHAIHLLFSANRWENAKQIQNHLLSGTTIVCDRYAYSGVAFSSAKVQALPSTSDTKDAYDENNQQQQSPLLSIEWCMTPDRGLPAPDCVLFLDLSQEDAEKRGGYVTLLARNKEEDTS